MYIIAGLGNPGEKYAKTKHNCGYKVIDKLAKSLEVEMKINKKYNAEIGFGQLDEQDENNFMLVKPTTYMNESGKAIGQIAGFYKIKPQNIIVIYDDIDLPLGKIRIRQSGSAGTHNGMKSIVSTIGNDFPRIRIGIETRDKSSEHYEEITSFVLTPFNKNELILLECALDRAEKGIRCFLENGVKKAMETFNDNSPCQKANN